MPLGGALDVVYRFSLIFCKSHKLNRLQTDKDEFHSRYGFIERVQSISATSTPTRERTSHNRNKRHIGPLVHPILEKEVCKFRKNGEKGKHNMAAKLASLV